MKRFIAGAECPGCQNIDSLYVNSEETAENYQNLYCTRCDYQAQRGEDKQQITLENADEASDENIKWH